MKKTLIITIAALSFASSAFAFEKNTISCGFQASYSTLKTLKSKNIDLYGIAKGEIIRNRKEILEKTINDPYGFIKTVEARSFFYFGGIYYDSEVVNYIRVKTHKMRPEKLLSLLKANTSDPIILNLTSLPKGLPAMSIDMLADSSMFDDMDNRDYDQSMEFETQDDRIQLSIYQSCAGRRRQ